MGTYSAFFLSAFWHGFYPAYYFTFMTGALTVEAARRVRRHLRPRMLTWVGESMYTVISFVVALSTINYTCLFMFMIDEGADADAAGAAGAAAAAAAAGSGDAAAGVAAAPGESPDTCLFLFMIDEDPQKSWRQVLIHRDPCSEFLK